MTEPIKKQILSINYEELWKKIEIIESEEGTPICKYNDGEQVFQINSKRPLQEAENWCKHLPIDDAGTLFVYG